MDGIGWLGLFVAALGVGMVLWGLTMRSRANALVGAAQAWPTAPGTMVAAEVMRGGTNRHPTFAPVVRYDYEVGGRHYSGERLRPGYVKVGSRRAAERMLQPYPVGGGVPVRYDPADPNSSLLELKASSAPLLTAIFGAALILLGGGIVSQALAGAFSRDKGWANNAGASPNVTPGFAASGAASANGQAGGAQARTWRGSYTCGQGDTGMEVTLRPLGQGRLEGTLSFFPLPANPGVPRGCYRITGQADATGAIALRGAQWVRQPNGYHMVDLSGRLGADNGITGQVGGGSCSQFQLQSVASPAESCP